MELSLVHAVRPPGLREDVRPPLLVLLHGIGASERQTAQFAARLDPRFVVASARGPITLRPGAYAWFHVAFTPRGPVIVPAEAEASWKAVAGFAQQAAKAYGCDPARIFVGGFSQGGIMALSALLTAPQRFAGALAMSARLLPEVLPHAQPGVRGKPVLVAHGMADPVLGVAQARWARGQLEALGADVTYREFAMGHEVTAESLDVVAGWLAARLDAGDAQTSKPHA